MAYNQDNTMQDKLNQLEELLKHHDWYYAMSEDMRYFRSGSKSYDEIWKLMKELKNNNHSAKADDLYKSYAPGGSKSNYS